MKTKLLHFLVVIAYTSQVWAQIPASGPGGGTPPPHILFNTGLDVTGSILNLRTVGLTDQRWEVSTTSPFTGFSQALKVPFYGTTNAPFWAPEVSGTNNYCHGWISTDFNCWQNPSDPANHGCIAGNTSLYFRITFNLPVNPVLVLDWDIAADDRVADIYVNNVIKTSPNSGGPNSPIKFRWCKDWVAGTNTIVVHVKSGPVPNPPPQNYKNWSGINIVSWGPGSGMSIAGSATVCNNTVSTYTAIPNVTNPVYCQWSSPFNGGASASTYSPYIGLNGGLINCYVIDPTLGGCVNAGTIYVTPVTPTITPTASSTLVCPSSSFILTASGASTYSWSSPIGSTLNPVVVTQTTGTNYAVYGWDANGCVSHTNIIIGMAPVPTISLNAMPQTICAGVSNVLLANGASTYTWLPVSPSPSIVGPANVVTISPPVVTSYTVNGTATNGCTNTAVLTLSPGPTIPLTVPDVTLCTDMGSCTTIGASSSFTGSVSYYWPPPVNSNLQNPNVCFVSSQIATVVANSTLGCATQATLAVTVQTCCPPPTETFSIPSTTACFVQFNDLSAYASTSGTFSGVGVTYSLGTYWFNAAQNLPSGTYQIAFNYTTAPFGCPYTLYQSVTIINPLPISITPTVGYCYYDPLGATLSATLNGATPFTYFWGPGLTPGTYLSGQTVTVIPTVTNIYTVYAWYTNCVATATVEVIPNYSCCPQIATMPRLSANTLYTGNTLNGPIVIDHDITITGIGNYKFETADFVMATGVKITVDPGVTLELSDAHLYSCSTKMWKGIEVLDGGNVTSTPGPMGFSTLIEDAEIAIHVANITADHATPLLNLDGVVFNNNSVGIRFENSILTYIPSLIKSCVFSQKNLPFASWTWPGSGTGQYGLRYLNAQPPTVLFGLYDLQGYPIGFPKSPYNPNIGARGIEIFNIGNISGQAPQGGVDISSWANPMSSEFNLFDHMEIGIDVTDASLTTVNNVFQHTSEYNPPIGNYGRGIGIRQTITGHMKSRLNLTPPPGSNPNTGNGFWDFYFGVKATNAYDIDIQEATFRSEQHSGSSWTWNQGFLYPNAGIFIESNRMNYKIAKNQFNNLMDGIYIHLSPGLYDDGSGVLQSGIYAGGLDISENYFGPEMSSAFAVGPAKYMYGAISILGDACNWQYVPQVNRISSNQLDRCYYGISVAGMMDYPIEIGGNDIFLTDMNGTLPSSYQYGIHLIDTKGNKIVTQNNVYARYPTHSPLELIGCYNNVKPEITCNNVHDGNWGFVAGGNNVGTWQRNTMSRLNYGLAIGQIGVQGDPNNPSDNEWIGSWPNGSYQTIGGGVSDALYVRPGYPYTPTLNGYPGTNNYSDPGALMPAQSPFFIGCPNSYVSPPQYRTVNLSYPEPLSESSLFIFPSPADDYISVGGGAENEVVKVSVFDLTGKLLIQKTLINASDRQLDISELPATMYFVELVDGDGHVARKKLIKN